MTLDDALHTFIAEGRELLEEMESTLLGLDVSQEAGLDPEAVNAIFRAAHTIKGSAGLFGMDQVVAFTHVAENVLDKVRAGQVPVDGALVSLLLSCCDHMRALVEHIAAGHRHADAALQAEGEPLLQALDVILRQATATGTATATAQSLAPAQSEPATETPAGGAGPADPSGSRHWHLSLRFGEGVLRNGMDPMCFLRYLGRIGRIRTLVTVADALPPAEAMDPERCHLGFELSLETTADKQQIENVFAFVLDDCRLQILPPQSKVADFVRLVQSLPEDAQRLGETLVAQSAGPQAIVTAAPGGHHRRLPGAGGRIGVRRAVGGVGGMRGVPRHRRRRPRLHRPARQGAAAGALLAEVQGISGSRIRATGDVALILDVLALIAQADRHLNVQYEKDSPCSAT